MTAKFSIHITTKNRFSDLKFTLDKIQHLIIRNDVECMIFDDGSTDGTSLFIEENYPNIILSKNESSKGLIYCRNQMLNRTKAKYAISLDDDAHFVSENILENIEEHFVSNPECGAIAFRIFWGLELPKTIFSKEVTERTKGFVGCGHVWNLQAWRDVPNYPEWFVFYGEEDFASFQLFKKKWEIHYLPNVLVHHRVDVKSRKKEKDYIVRFRRSLRSGWYLYFLFYPLNKIPRLFFYTLWTQIKLKVFKGDLKTLWPILQALFDCLWNFFRLIKQSNRLTTKEFNKYIKLSDTKLYWNPEKKN